MAYPRYRSMSIPQPLFSILLRGGSDRFNSWAHLCKSQQWLDFDNQLHAPPLHRSALPVSTIRRFTSALHLKEDSFTTIPCRSMPLHVHCYSRLRYAFPSHCRPTLFLAITPPYITLLILRDTSQCISIADLHESTHICCNSKLVRSIPFHTIALSWAHLFRSQPWPRFADQLHASPWRLVDITSYSVASLVDTIPLLCIALLCQTVPIVADPPLCLAGLFHCYAELFKSFP